VTLLWVTISATQSSKCPFSVNNQATYRRDSLHLRDGGRCCSGMVLIVPSLMPQESEPSWWPQKCRWEYGREEGMFPGATANFRGYKSSPLCLLFL
jgi:hypothetical protein